MTKRDAGIRATGITGGPAPLRLDWFLRPEPWMSDAACATTDDPEMFFPEPRSSLSAEVVLTCGRCTVRSECLGYAIANDERFGVWGGTTPRDRSLAAADRRLERAEALVERARAMPTARPQPVRPTRQRVANLESTNAERTAEAAGRTTAAVERAIETFGPVLTPSERLAGELRLRHPTASIAELGALASPPISKATVSSALRRLLSRTETP